MVAATTRQAAGESCPRDAAHPTGARAAGRLLVLGQVPGARTAAGHRAAGRRAAVEAAGARRAVLRRAVLGRLRHRGDPLRPAAVLRAGRLHPGAPADAAGPVRRAACRAVLPRGRVGVHQGGRLVRGGQGELRPAGRPGGRGRAADRLRGHGGGADRRRQRRDRLRVPRAVPHPGHRPEDPAGYLGRRDRRHVPGQPARHPRGGPGLRAAHLPVRRLGGRDDRHRPGPRGGRRPAARRPGRGRGGHRLALRADRHRRHVHHGEGLRQRRVVADRNRGRVQRRQRAAPAGRTARAADPRHPGHARGRADRGDLLARARHPRDPLHGRLPHRARPGGAGRLRSHRRRAGDVLRAAGRDRRHLVHRREHQLHRVPVPGQLRRRGLLPAPLAGQARAPAGVLERDHRCWPRCR